MLLWDIGRGSVIVMKEYKLSRAKRVDGSGIVLCGRAYGECNDG